jgi:hypothetical protein
MMDKPFVTPQRTVRFHLEAHATKKVGSLSAPRATLSGPNHIALRTCFPNDRSHHLFVKSSNHTLQQKHDDYDAIVPRGLEHQNARAFSARNHIRSDTKKSSPGAHEPAEDIEKAKVYPRQPKRMICASYNRSK